MQRECTVVPLVAQKSSIFSSCQPRTHQSCILANPILKPSCRPRREANQKTNTNTIHWIQSAMQKRAQLGSCQPRNHRSCNLANPNLKPSRSPRLESKPNTNTSTIHWIQSTMPKECTVGLQLVKQTALSFFAAIYVLTDSARCLHGCHNIL